MYYQLGFINFNEHSFKYQLSLYIYLINFSTCIAIKGQLEIVYSVDVYFENLTSSRGKCVLGRRICSGASVASISKPYPTAIPLHHQHNQHGMNMATIKAIEARSVRRTISVTSG